MISSFITIPDLMQAKRCCLASPAMIVQCPNNANQRPIPMINQRLINVQSNEQTMAIQCGRGKNVLVVDVGDE